MEIKVSEAKDIVIIPSVFEKEDKPMKFVFRMPNAEEMLNFSIFNNVNELVASCFKSFENKVVVKKGDKELAYNDYIEFINLGASKVIDDIHAECAMKFISETNILKEKADATEKK